eukprot:c27150_g2_i1 orf=148-540(+)
MLLGAVVVEQSSSTSSSGSSSGSSVAAAITTRVAAAGGVGAALGVLWVLFSSLPFFPPWSSQLDSIPVCHGYDMPRLGWLVRLLPLLLHSVTFAFANSEGDALHNLRQALTDPSHVLQSWDPTLVNPCTW